MKVNGFVLIELLLATAISAMLGAVLFSAFTQINRLIARTEVIMNVYTKAALLQHQLETDLQGAFVPIRAQHIKKNNKKNDKKSEAPKKQSAFAKASADREKKPLTHVFYGVNKEGNLDTLTFITSNPLQVYVGQKTGKAKPRIARIVYRLEPDEQEEGSYILRRQEAYNLDFNAFKKDSSKPIRALEVIDGIKEINMTYFLDIKNQTDKKDKGKKERKEFKQWNIESQATDKQDSPFAKASEDRKQKKRKIPNEVALELTLWNREQERQETFMFKIALLSDPAPFKTRKISTVQPKRTPKEAAQQKLKEIRERQTGLHGSLDAHGASVGVRGKNGAQKNGVVKSKKGGSAQKPSNYEQSMNRLHSDPLYQDHMAHHKELMARYRKQGHL